MIGGRNARLAADQSAHNVGRFTEITDNHLRARCPQRGGAFIF